MDTVNLLSEFFTAETLALEIEPIKLYSPAAGLPGEWDEWEYPQPVDWMGCR
jgi:hypothetical protein